MDDVNLQWNIPLKYDLKWMTTRGSPIEISICATWNAHKAEAKTCKDIVGSSPVTNIDVENTRKHSIL